MTNEKTTNGAASALSAGFDPMPDDAAKAVRPALIDADHLAECAERLLAALNRKAGAVERVEVADMGDIGAPQRAADELADANEQVSEYWRGVQGAAYEYRKRAERARKAMGSTAGLGLNLINALTSENPFGWNFMAVLRARMMKLIVFLQRPMTATVTLGFHVISNLWWARNVHARSLTK